ncbi:MAG: biotin/lipoyl-containing protein, partial [Planctomycetota bacterium]
MAIELKVPEVGESITEVMIGVWKKQEGDVVAVDESIVEIESDKATVELPAPASGTIIRVLKASGEKAVVGEVIGILEPAGVAAPAAAPVSPQPTVGIKYSDGKTTIGSVQPPVAPAMPSSVMPSSAIPSRVMPAAARVLGEAGVPAAGVVGTGPGGRITKVDAVAATAKPAPPAV